MVSDLGLDNIGSSRSRSISSTGSVSSSSTATTSMSVSNTDICPHQMGMREVVRVAASQVGIADAVEACDNVLDQLLLILKAVGRVH